MSADEPAFLEGLDKVMDLVKQRYHDLSDLPTTPHSASVVDTIAALPTSLPQTGLGVPAATDYLIDTLLPGVLQAQNGPRYFGFVTGGVTPAAQLADILSSSYDENVQVTLPGVTAATAIECRTLEMVLDLLSIPRDRYMGRTITTGATASNVLGLGKSDYLLIHLDWKAEGRKRVPETICIRHHRTCQRDTLTLRMDRPSHLLCQVRRLCFCPFTLISQS
jgi:glutamate/tyrosine decarboxylase-like PLP-dependent enzyme